MNRVIAVACIDCSFIAGSVNVIVTSTRVDYNIACETAVYNGVIARTCAD